MTKPTIRDHLFLLALYLIACGAEGWVELLF